MKQLLKLTGCVALAGLMSSCGSVQEEANYQIIPLPQEIVTSQVNPFILKSGVKILYPEGNEKMQRNAQFLADYLKTATGKDFSIEAGTEGKNAIVLALGSEVENPESYQLKVTDQGVTITAPTEAGVFYGIQTLRKSLPIALGADVALPAVEIKDAPRFGYRGAHFDVSRHFFTIDEVKTYIDMLALHNMNRLHWHITDDQGWRLEIKSLPRLTEVGAWRAPRVGQWWQRAPQQPGEETTYGGFYTQEDVKEVLAYAAERYVRVIPEIDVPGHSLAALVAYPDLACMKAPSAVGVGNKFYGEDENTLCVGKDATFEFMDKVLTEVAALFPDEYIHIGGDECFKGFWHKCPRCQARMKAENLKNENELQSYFIHRMESILKEKGKKLIGWDEIIDGGPAPDATVMSWRGMEGGIKSAKAGHHVIMTPTEHCYIDLWQGEPSVEPDTYSMCRLKDSYSFNPVPDSVPAEMILGGQGNLWAESVPTFRHAEYMTWPRGWALAEVLWTGPSKTDWDRFWPRVERHFVRADQAQINYARSMYNAIVTPYYTKDGVLEIKLDSEPGNLDIYYTFDNTDPDNFTPKYEAPLRIPKNATWLRIVTYRDNKPIGKVITLTIKELEKRADNTRHVVGNL